MEQGVRRMKKEIKNDSFVFYATNLEVVEALEQTNPELANEFLKAIVEYGIYGEYKKGNPMVDALMIQTGFGIDKAKDRYAAAIENGKKGGRPKVNLNEQEVLEKKKELGTWKETAQFFGVTEQSLKNYRNQWENEKNPKNPKNPNNPNITIIENEKNPKNPKNPNTAVVENPKNPKNLNDNDNDNDNDNVNVNKKEKDIFSFSWFDDEEEEERKRKIVESAKQIRLAANPDNRFRDEEEQEYFDFIKGANIEKGMSETAAEEDAWQMILDDREYWDSKVKIS